MGFSEERLRIDTPENVIFGYEVAGIGSRFMAALIDTLIIILLQIIVGISLLLLYRLAPSEEVANWLIALFGLLLFILLWGYYIFFEMLWNGQSPGKWRIGLRVIRLDGTPITFTESLIRNLIRIIDFLPFGYGIGVVTMFAQSQSRRLGDLAAGTIVVHEQTAINLDDLKTRTSLPTPTLITPSLTTSQVTTLPIERLTPTDLQLIQEFLQRYQQMAGSQAVAQKILDSLYTRMGLSLPPIFHTDPVQILDQIMQQSNKEI